MGVKIRTAEPSDVPALEIIRRQAIESAFAAVYDRSVYADAVATPDEAVPKWIESEDHLLLVAASDVTPVAFTAVDRTTGRIYHLHTAPDYQRRGYASELVDAVTSRVSTDEPSQLWTWCPEPSLSFFESYGFIRTGRMRSVDGIEQWYVELPLSTQ